ncbi:outer membrane beta-barrel protein [Pelagibaculum spongiae]|uniref:Outer membrane protein beta-barrel domain-containing protein n=1 Tax=Pelagibaculum spongiae TaxID=2080658 RepID=A0A2V1H1W4_9GAMM|nr:outer membrane beta-barrel protein [Pelagibaculum spongiae]PVZ70371.1 hypothetical protein DC094_07190 [Pelagibaculum spongiae]
MKKNIIIAMVLSGMITPVYAQNFFGEQLIATTAQQTDNSRSDLDGDTLMKLGAGWNFTENLALTLTYMESEGDESNRDAASSNTFTVKPQDIVLAARYTGKINQKISWFTSAGIDFWRLKITESNSADGWSNSPSATDSGMGFAAGLGANYQFTSIFSLIAETGYIHRPDTFEKSVNKFDLNTPYFGIGARLGF